MATQDLCPLDVADHLLVARADPVASALAMDALTAPGPADPACVSLDVRTTVHARSGPGDVPDGLRGDGRHGRRSGRALPEGAGEPQLKTYARNSEHA